MPDINSAAVTTQQPAQQVQAEAEIDHEYLALLADLDPDLPGIVFGLWK